MGLLTRLAAFAGRHPWWWLLAYLVVTAALYQLAIRAPLYTPLVVQPTALDAHIPLLPWTAAPYLTYFALMPSFVILARAHPARGPLLAAAGLVVLGNLALNLLVPTEIASPLSPRDAEGWLLATVIAGDAPGAALPSGHVALPLALAILGWRGRVRGAWIYLPWTAALAASVLTTKQHYLPDVAGGLAWGALGATLAWRSVRAIRSAPRLPQELSAC